MPGQFIVRRRGFTLIELLTVIAIIALLLSILIPSVNAARNQAKAVSTQAAIGSMGTALEMFKSDNALGGDYVPSRPDQESGGSFVASSPYDNSVDDLEIAGSGLLLWGLVGADLLGSPGFRDLDGDGVWANNTGSDDPEDGLYTLVESGDDIGEPIYRRADLFVDATADMSEDNNLDDGEARFVVPKERGLSANEARGYPLFLDAFGTPMLYFRANLGGRRVSDPDADDPGVGIYNWVDNRPLIDNGHDDVVNMKGGNPGHQLRFVDPGNATVEDIMTDDNTFKGTFTRYILDPKVQAKPTPQRRDSYLLISAGIDQIYGTADDVTNFDPNTD